MEPYRNCIKTSNRRNKAPFPDAKPRPHPYKINRVTLSLICILTLLIVDMQMITSRADAQVKLPRPTGNQIYFGAFPDFGGPEDIVTADRIAQFNSLAGKKIIWAYFSNNWGQDGVVFPRARVETIRSTGTIPFVRMMPRRFFEDPDDKTFSLQKIINGQFDADLHQYARDVKAYGHMVLFDFAVEMNGDWFPWSGIFNGGATTDGYGDPAKADGPERFVDAYRHIIAIFRAEHADNVTWFFHPDVYSQPEGQAWNAPKAYYPGDDYIDWIGISAYGPQHPAEDYWDTFSLIITERQNQILAISSNRPLALLEFGVTDHHPLGRKDAWITDAFNTILDENHPVQFKAVSWWHENWEESDNLWATIRIDSSAESLAAFRDMAGHSRFVSSITATTPGTPKTPQHLEVLDTN